MVLVLFALWHYSSGLGKKNVLSGDEALGLMASHLRPGSAASSHASLSGLSQLQLFAAGFLHNFCFNPPAVFHLPAASPECVRCPHFSPLALITPSALAASGPVFSLSGVHIVPLNSPQRDVKDWMSLLQGADLAGVTGRIHTSAGCRQPWGEGASLCYWPWVCGAKFEQS